jgi:hypothetical protein
MSHLGLGRVHYPHHLLLRPVQSNLQGPPSFDAINADTNAKKGGIFGPSCCVGLIFCSFYRRRSQMETRTTTVVAQSPTGASSASAGTHPCRERDSISNLSIWKLGKEGQGQIVKWTPKEPPIDDVTVFSENCPNFLQ